MKAFIVLGISVTVLSFGCLNVPFDKELLSFLVDGHTSRKEILSKLGEPSLMLETERILTYRLVGDDHKGYIVRAAPPLDGIKSWAGTNYSLVLVFDQSGFLASHSMVRLR